MFHIYWQNLEFFRYLIYRYVLSHIIILKSKKEQNFLFLIFKQIKQTLTVCFKIPNEFVKPSTIWLDKDLKFLWKITLIYCPLIHLYFDFLMKKRIIEFDISKGSEQLCFMWLKRKIWIYYNLFLVTPLGAWSQLYATFFFLSSLNNWCIWSILQVKYICYSMNLNISFNIHVQR